MFAEIIIPLALPKNYTWSVPEHFREKLKLGCRVEVNLGKYKKYAGIVKRIHNQKPATFEPKEILNILDEMPVVFEQQLKLWEWMAAYYMCTEGEVMAAALPSHFKLSSETVLIYNEAFGENFSNLDHDEYLVAEALLIKKELVLSEVQLLIQSSHTYPVTNRLLQKGVCFVWETIKPTYVPKKEIFVLLHNQYEDETNLEKLLNEDKKLQRAEKQMELLLSYLHLQKIEGEVTKSSLLKKSGATDAQLKGLVEKNILSLEKRVVDRINYGSKSIQLDVELTELQLQVVDKIKKSFLEKPVCLLHGVTGSGKTLVYIQLIEELLRNGKQVLYLLPEIALTSQIIRRLQKHFGGNVGVYHSRFSQNERVEIWNKVKSGEIKIVLGARSSIFLPYQNLGLVIIDEEHDSSFKQQEPAPRYHGRDVAVYLSALMGANTLLGSATPSLETFSNAISSKFGLVELLERFGPVELPSIEIIETKKIAAKEKGKIIVSPILAEAINKALQNKKQVILFQNRRGYSPLQICSLCGWIPQCKHCDVSLTFHKLTNKLICHYCGTNYPPLQTCTACGSHKFLQKNFGTEKVEELLVEKFPNARVARMDLDTMRGKNAHEALIQQFEQQRIDILVGTQMVVKGLDFDHVDLVGILDADALLNFSDFRVNENAFQMMEQVSGRAGRKGSTGKVMIQTMQPQHPVLQFVIQHNFRNMYVSEIEKRKQFFYPPFSRLIHLRFKHKLKEVVHEAAAIFAERLALKFKKYLIGPAEAIVNRIRNQYLVELLCKLPKDTNTILLCKNEIHEQIGTLQNEKKYKSVSVIVNVDPL